MSTPVYGDAYYVVVIDTGRSKTVAHRYGEPKPNDDRPHTACGKPVPSGPNSAYVPRRMLDPKVVRACKGCFDVD